MIAIIDKRAPTAAKNKLRQDFHVLEFMTGGAVYPGISGHPDIFIFQCGQQLVIAPNTPFSFVDALRENGVHFQWGVRHSQGRYPATTAYNVACSEHYLIHHRRHTDPEILLRMRGKTFLHVSQAYSRCNTIALRQDAFITSDKGIFQVMKKRNMDVLYVAPQGILLPPYEYGFIGGTAGIAGDTVYFTGSLKYFPEGEKLRHFIQQRDHRIIELYEGPLYDGGGILFLKPNTPLPISSP